MITFTDAAGDTFTVADRYELEDKLNELIDRDAWGWDDHETGEPHTLGEAIDDLTVKLGYDSIEGLEALLGISIHIN